MLRGGLDFPLTPSGSVAVPSSMEAMYREQAARLAQENKVLQVRCEWSLHGVAGGQRRKQNGGGGGGPRSSRYGTPLSPGQPRHSLAVRGVQGCAPRPLPSFSSHAPCIKTV
jgi:hypothetical protein